MAPPAAAAAVAAPPALPSHQRVPLPREHGDHRAVGLGQINDFGAGGGAGTQDGGSRQKLDPGGSGWGNPVTA